MLKDIKGEQSVDFIADLVEPIINILEDENVAEFFKKEQVPEGMTAGAFFMSRAKKSLPLLLKSHREDIVAILAAFDGTSVDEYRQDLTPPKLLKDAFALLQNEELLSFLELPQTKEPEKQSGSAAASSEEEPQPHSFGIATPSIGK